MKAAWIACCVISSSVLLLAEQRSTPAGRGAPPPQGVQLACAADLGVGVTTGRSFCDVLIGASPTDSIAVTMPVRKAPTTLTLDLHNRFMVPASTDTAVCRWVSPQYTWVGNSRPAYGENGGAEVGTSPGCGTMSWAGVAEEAPRQASANTRPRRRLNIRATRECARSHRDTIMLLSCWRRRGVFLYAGLGARSYYADLTTRPPH
jgi:hypothetical protein